MARPGLTSHRKFKRLSRALGSSMMARGALELLWDSCYESGEDYVGTAEDIEGAIGWTGEPGALTRALVDSGAPEGEGFIEAVESDVSGIRRYKVHDLWHHAPEYVAKRRRREEERRLKTSCLPNGDQSPPNGRTPSPSPSPSPSPGKNISAPPRAADTPADDVVLTFPTVGKGPDSWFLTKRQLHEWEILFPGVHVLSQCRTALAWIRANKGRTKTYGGMPRFLVGWLSRSTNRGGGRSAEDRGHRPEQYRGDAGGDWFEECKRVHGGACQLDRHRHALRMRSGEKAAS